jgi:hypothetical protein
VKALVNAALVGLERAGEAVTDEASAALVAGLERQPSPEQRLLLQLGIAGTRARAGRKAGAAARPTPAPAEVRAACTDSFALLVAELCREKQGALLAEALTRLDALNARLPPWCLVDLASVKDPKLQPHAGRVAGERGRWLAAHNPDWRWLVEGETALASGDRKRIWDEGALASRLAALRSIRAEAPVEGRAWVEGVWKEEKAAVREQILDAFAGGLSPDDEVFLTSVLADRSVSVRTKAAALLAHLEGSGLAQRMRQRAEALFARGRALEVQPPEAFDAAWARDGLVEKPPAGVGAKAFWMAQILALVPPRHWERTLGAAPEALVAAAVAGQWAEPVLRGWVEATISFGANAWAAPLLRAHATAPPARRVELAGQLFPLMDQETAESFVVPLLESADGFLSEMLALPTPWSRTFGDAALAALERVLRAGLEDVPGRYAWRNAIELVATALPPPCFARALALETSGLPDDPTATLLRTPLEALRTTLTIRQRIHEEPRP